MPIQSLRCNFPGDNYQSARLCRLHTSDAIASVTAAGYLNPYLLMQSIGLYTTDFVHVAASDATQIYKPSFSASGVVTLVALS